MPPADDGPLSEKSAPAPKPDNNATNGARCDMCINLREHSRYGFHCDTGGVTLLEQETPPQQELKSCAAESFFTCSS